MAEKVRLGGMALSNGVLVHGPTAWACAVRTADGRVKIASERKRLVGAGVTMPLLRGPARLLEAFVVLPRVKRALPEARMPFEGRTALAAMAGTAVAVQVLRRSRLNETAQELAGAVLATAPAVLTIRSGALAGYHGAEHIAIGTYEHDRPTAKEHERCGSHLVGPLILTAAAGNMLAARAPSEIRPAARLAASIGAVAAATEIFGWMTRHPDRRLARALARPGHELQHRLSTAEPSSDQLEVARAALAACLELEDV
ncbi:MAG TPA: DUF1385 domain-containing protein [Gaiellaceae bacterium]|jgi:uncharacterized protein YqhQ|nr:DUF1385 domain-containing protein [Gaiellaceae bacterium]